MKARILPCTSDNLRLAGDLLRAGEVVAAPTETVYGLAGLAFDPNALSKVFAAKERPTFDPLIVHVAAPNPKQARDWLSLLDQQQVITQRSLSPSQLRVASELIRNFWPGPLTLVLPKHERIPDLATSGLPTVAVRAPARPAMQALIQFAGGPLAAPSANRFGGISPTSAQDVFAELGDRVSLILDDGPCDIGLESTIVAVATDGQVHLLRPGGVPVESLRATLGAFGQDVLVLPGNESPRDGAPLIAPGALPSHYAPRKPLHLLPAALKELTTEKRASFANKLSSHVGVGLLVQRGDPDSAVRRFTSLFPSDHSPRSITALSLSRRGDVIEAAHNLFSMLRRLDDDPTTDLIVAEPVSSPTGLGFAIADRLHRASAPKFSSSPAVKDSRAE